ncbi:hypothetical protein DPEC_G00182810 [Dallia pectoralis]|uniref:Uncharacterized protein n=1 Tax=Dallia pectoralis TaxID=75939 RepID=A0ACC2GAH5_DALPE|nr:hypothetical protein DPEC_G00182810 [Dallia pectoralis]
MSSASSNTERATGAARRSRHSGLHVTGPHRGRAASPRSGGKTDSVGPPRNGTTQLNQATLSGGLWRRRRLDNAADVLARNTTRSADDTVTVTTPDGAGVKQDREREAVSTLIRGRPAVGVVRRLDTRRAYAGLRQAKAGAAKEPWYGRDRWMDEDEWKHLHPSASPPPPLPSTSPPPPLPAPSRDEV